MADRIKLRGAHGYRPLQQGDLDRLCGLYAAINAIGVVLAPVRPLRASEIEDLMERGVHHLSGKQKLVDTLINGMARKRQLSLTRTLVKQVSAITGHDLVVEPLTGPQNTATRVALLQVIENSLLEGDAVIVCIENTHDHYTVVIGSSLARLTLADSDGLHWLPISHVGPCMGSVAYRHCIRSRGAVRVGVQRQILHRDT